MVIDLCEKSSADCSSRPAITQGCSTPFRARYATRSFGENQPKFYYGVPRIWNHLVRSPPAVVIRYLHSSSTMPLLFSSLADGDIPSREGKKSGEHYLICGVQGDFTRSLVENPPKYIWTRQLKVRNILPLCVDGELTDDQFAGVSNTSTLYKRGIRVCTGTGLGAALSTCLQVRLVPLDQGLGFPWLNS